MRLTMKIAVTSQNRKTVTGHAAKCRKFWLYRIEADQVEDKTLLELPKEQAFHESLGGGLQLRLRQRGIEAWSPPRPSHERFFMTDLARPMDRFWRLVF
jgi:hypothetical protein